MQDQLLFTIVYFFFQNQLHGLEEHLQKYFTGYCWIFPSHTDFSKSQLLKFAC